MNKIIYTRSTGGVTLVDPAVGGRLATKLVFRDGSYISSEVPIRVDNFYRKWPVEGVEVTWAETEEEWLNRVIALAVPTDAINVQIVDSEKLPQDHFFFDAWEQQEKKVTVNLEKAKAIVVPELRRRRESLLAALDIDFLKSLEELIPNLPGDKTKILAAVEAKEALRNVTVDPRLDAAQTAEELKDVMEVLIKK